MQYYFAGHGWITTTVARRAQKAYELRLLPRGGERKRAYVPRETRGAGLALEVAAVDSHRGHVPEGRGFLPE